MQTRLAAFKEQAYARGFAAPSSPKERHWSHAFFELYGDLPLAERQARSFAYALEHEPVCIHPLTRIAGQIFQGVPGAGCPERTGSAEHPGWADFSVVPAAERRAGLELPEGEFYARHFGQGGFPGHICWDFGLLLELGITGMIARCREKEPAADPEGRAFYAGVRIALEGLRAWAGRHLQVLEEMAGREPDPGRRQELLEMAAVCRQVPDFPAASFRQAVQSFWFQHLAVMFENPFGGNGPGRLDYYLWPYLERDLQAGRTDMEEARELIAELFIKLHERIAPHDGWVEAVPVGGRKPDGASAVNPLSYLILEVITQLRQTHPSVYVRLPDGAPDDFVELTVRYLLEGQNRAQVYGDDAIIAALHQSGVALEDARHWTAGGCMEVSPQGCNGDLLFSFAHNVARTFELVVNGGCLLQTGERIIPHRRTLADYQRFEELYADFAGELDRELRLLMRRLDIWLESYARYRPSFLLSSMTHDCLERGRSINAGGARYSHYGGSGVGIPNVGDSLFALKRAVFDTGRFTGAQVLEALRADFGGQAQLQSYLRALPKYGADHEEADAMVDRVLGSFVDSLAGHRPPFGGRVLPVILGFVWVVDFGRQVGATPDGRHAGRPLAHGLSPQSGAALKGITAAIHSATRLSLQRVGGGGAMMWDLDPAWATPAAVKPLLQTFIQQGGHIFQGNVVPVARLRAAQQRPEEHRDLIVRVAGYSARFTSLSAATQEEIIARYQYRG
jgi:trans-4-hydroxy-L-proline dehydratase